MIRKIVLAGAAAALIVTPAIAGSHGGKKMDKSCAAKLQKLERKGMTGGKNAALYKKAKALLKAGDEKGCLQMVYKMKKAMKSHKSYGGYGGYGKY